MRDLSPDFLAAVRSASVSPAMLVSLDFEGSPVYVWSGIGNFGWDSKVWQGVGSLAQIAPIEEYSDIRAGSLQLTLTNVPNTALSSVPSLIFKRRTAKIFLAMFVGDTRELIGVESIFKGTMDTMSISRSPQSSSIQLNISNELARLRDTGGSIYSDAHQQRLFPGDTSLRFIQSIQDVKVTL